MRLDRRPSISFSPPRRSRGINEIAAVAVPNLSCLPADAILSAAPQPHTPSTLSCGDGSIWSPSVLSTFTRPHTRHESVDTTQFSLRLPTSSIRRSFVRLFFPHYPSWPRSTKNPNGFEWKETGLTCKLCSSWSRRRRSKTGLSSAPNRRK